MNTFNSVTENTLNSPRTIIDIMITTNNVIPFVYKSKPCQSIRPFIPHPRYPCIFGEQITNFISLFVTNNIDRRIPYENPLIVLPFDQTVWNTPCFQPSPDSKVHGANMGPIWSRQDPGGPHVGPMNLAIWVWLFEVKIEVFLYFGGGLCKLFHQSHDLKEIRCLSHVKNNSKHYLNVS